MVMHGHILSVSLESAEISSLYLEGTFCFIKWQVTVAILDDLQISFENQFLH